jgi:hypothetical protein
MLSSLVYASLLALPSTGAIALSTFPVVCLDSEVAPVLAAGVTVDDELRSVYQRGRSYEVFLDNATQRAELWHGNTEKAEGIDMALVDRARAVGGTWRFLAVAIDSCSDSVSTIPYLARLVSMVDGLEMRVVDPTAGRGVMESHRTPDGRPSTPTVLILNEEWEEVGCFIERPPKLQTWILEEAFGPDEVFSNKMAWYAEDAGDNTVEAFVEALEAASRGEKICR